MPTNEAALWSSNVSRSHDGVLTIAGVSAIDIAREFGTPAYIVSRSVGVLLPVWKIEELPAPDRLRLAIEVVELVVYFGGHELHWW